MEDADSLDALVNLLNQLSENPYDISLHAQHIRLAAASGMEEQVQAARKLMTGFWAATEDVWMPMIEVKKAEGVDTVEGVQSVLAVYELAEADYLSMTILQSHLTFLVDRYETFSTMDPKPADLGALFSTDWTRTAISNIVSKGVAHLTKGHLLWDAQRDWELEILEKTPVSKRAPLVNHIDQLFLERLQQPHSSHEETFQAYSSFTTAYKPAAEYESLLIAASKAKSRSIKWYDRREPLELSLTRANYSLETYAYYISTERRPRKPDMFILNTLYERAIAEAAKRRFAGEVGAEEYLRVFWCGYCDVLRMNDVSKLERATIFKRSHKSVPGSGEVWARYLRFIEVAQSDDANDEAQIELDSVANIHTRALATKLVQGDVEQIVVLTLARAGYELRQRDDEANSLANTAIALEVLEEGIAMVRRASPQGDPRFRLEKLLAETCRKLGLTDDAKTAWKTTAEHFKNSYLAWTSYTDLLIQLDEYEDARTVFKNVCFKNLDWPEAVWEAWTAFEYQVGDVEELEECLDTVERARNQANARRAKEAEKMAYQVSQSAGEQQASLVPVTEVLQAVHNGGDSAPMDVDVFTPTEGGKKRKAEESPAPEESKRAKKEAKAAPLKRDRENSTVFVADLPRGVTEDDLQALFKDCGKIREIKVTELPQSYVATVEFLDRESVPPALTKDKKRLNGEEVAVHLAWHSTLYITNFPEKTDDDAIRTMFGSYGTIFDVRWPSKKYKSTRRFCYVQYTHPASAQSALELHGCELDPGQPLSVLISNPERKKERTDADANERELYVAGLSKFATKSDLEKLFRTYGAVKEVRMALDDKDQCRGFAFVEFEQEADAYAALAANNHELKKRRIAVTVADSRVRARHKDEASATRRQRAEVQSKSLRVKNLPPGTQEGLLQQALEKVSPVKRVEVFEEQHEAVVEFENAADMGSFLLKPEPFQFQANVLEFSAEGAGTGGKAQRPVAPPPSTGGAMFVPRSAVSRPRAGLGRVRKPGISGSATSTSTFTPAGPSQSKVQDDFRKMLGERPS